MFIFKLDFLFRSIFLFVKTLRKKLRTFEIYNVCSEIFLILLVFSGCIRGQKEPLFSQKNINTDFRVLEITGISLNTQNHTSWNIPTQKIYEFRVCLISRSTNSALPGGQAFEIIRPDKRRDIEETDDLGCLVWQEIMAFNFTYKSHYVEKKRILRGMGVFRGISIIRLGVNPWAEYRNESIPEIVDLNRTQIAENQIISENTEKQMTMTRVTSLGSQLFIQPEPSIRIESIRDLSDGKVIRITVRVNPFLMPLNMRDKGIKTPINGGRFKIFATLTSEFVGLNSDEHMILTPSLSQGLGYDENEVHPSGSLTFQIEVNLKRRSDMGLVHLALKVDPINPPYNLKSYEGLFSLGPFKNLYSFKSGPEVKGSYSFKPFNYKKHLDQATNFEALVKDKLAKDSPPVYFRPIEQRFIRIAPGETATRRTVKYRLSTVVIDSIDGSPVVNQPFIIKKHFSGQIEEKRTDGFGRLIWFDSLDHLYYQKEKYFFPRFTIVKKIGNYSKKLTVRLNPWDAGWTFGEDVRGIEEDLKNLKSAQAREPLIMIDAFRYQTIRFRYVIDHFMMLNVKKAVVIALDPLVQKFSIKDGRTHFEPLRDGIYLAKVALVKFYRDPFYSGIRLFRNEQTERNYIMRVGSSEDTKKGEFTTVIKKLLRVQAGRITTPLEFSLRDLRMMSIRSNIMVQLEPIDEAKLLETNIVYQNMEKEFKDYLSYNSQENPMSPEEKEAFEQEKLEEFKRESEKLLTFLEKQKALLKHHREEVSNIYYKRYQQIISLENRILSGQKTQEMSFKEIMSISYDDYVKRRLKVRESYDQLITSLDARWQDSRVSWEELRSKVDKKGLSMSARDQVFFYPDEYDYLYNMQEFMDELDLSKTVGHSELARLYLNNYTINPAAPFINLDLYRDPNVGLKKRTFIGPCTLVLNDNLSELRPTDTLDERYADRIDSSEDLLTEPFFRRIKPPDNSAFEDSAYDDSLKPFSFPDKNLQHVDHIIPRHIENEKRYIKEMFALSSLGRFVNIFNYEYVSLKDAPLMNFVEGCKFETADIEEECLEEQKEKVTQSADFLKAFEGSDDMRLLYRFFDQNHICYLDFLNNEIQHSRSLESLWDFAFKESFLQESEFFLECREKFYGHPTFLGVQHYIEKQGGEIPPFDPQDVKERWISEGVNGFDLLDALRICRFISQKTVENLINNDFLESLSWWDQTFKKVKETIASKHPYWQQSSLFHETPQEYLLDYCISKIRYVPQAEKVFFDELSVQRRYRILETGSYQHLAGKNMNLNVGTDFVLSNLTNLSHIYELGFSLKGSMAIGSVMGRHFNLIPLEGALNYSNVYAKSRESEEVRNVNTSLAVFLVVQKAEMKIEIKKHEKCLTLRLAPLFFKDIDAEKMRFKDEDYWTSNKQIIDIISKGYLICTGEEEYSSEENPYSIFENYYYITQHFTAGDMLDEANLLNHVWLLALRGDRDFHNFVEMVDGKLKSQKGEIIEVDSIYRYPLSHLNRVYRQVEPSFPGMYTVPDDHPMTVVAESFWDIYSETFPETQNDRTSQ